MEKKQNSKVIGIVILVILIIAAIIGAGYYAVFNPKTVLLREINRISSMDVTKDDFQNYEIKSSGEYAKVEEAAKEYFADYSKNLQAGLESIKEENILAVASQDNLLTDAPNFETTLNKIKEMKESFNTSMDEIIRLMDEEAIMEKVKAKQVKEKYEELYRFVMFDEATLTQMKDQKEELEATKTSINTMLDAYEGIYTLLANNPGTWKYENGTVSISKEDVLTQYNNYIMEIQNIE